MSTWDTRSTRARIAPTMLVSFQSATPAVAALPGDRSWVKDVDGTHPADELTLQISGESLVAFRQLLNYAMNCRWEQMPEDMRTLSDILNHGNKMPSHRDPLHDAKPATQS